MRAKTECEVSALQVTNRACPIKVTSNTLELKLYILTGFYFFYYNFRILYLTDKLRLKWTRPV